MTTEQSEAPLERLAANAGQEPVGQVAGADLDLGAPYQRGSVWEPLRQRNLIRSLLRGIPVGNVYLNYRGGGGPDVVVDGKQRIEAIRAFLSGDLPVPASWFGTADTPVTVPTPDGPFVRYTDLTDAGRGRFNRCTITTQRTTLATVEAEAELFDLINFGGVPQ